MAIPSLDENGLLPRGIHPCSREDLLARFGEVGDRRRLYELFLDLVAPLSELQVRGDLFVGGSFVTKKFKPSDIDVAIDLSREPPSSPSPRVAWRLSEDFYPKGLQLLPVLAVGRNYLEWLQQVRPFDCMVLGLPVNHRKGILRVA